MLFSCPKLLAFTLEIFITWRKTVIGVLNKKNSLIEHIAICCKKRDGHFMVSAIAQHLFSWQTDCLTQPHSNQSHWSSALSQSRIIPQIKQALHMRCCKVKWGRYTLVIARKSSNWNLNTDHCVVTRCLSVSCWFALKVYKGFEMKIDSCVFFFFY